MAKGPRTVLALPDGIAAHWDLPDAAVEPLLGGYHSDVVRVGELVVRRERGDPASVAWEHELLRWLEPATPEVVAPLPARDGATLLVLEGCIGRSTAIRRAGTSWRAAARSWA